MIRDVDLVSYLPPFLRGYKEQNSALNSENPEFTLVWNAVDKVLKNEFIETADEYGISRYEKILGILPMREDTLESRRLKVLIKWSDSVPYTYKALLQKLSILYGDKLTLVDKFLEYKLQVITHFDLEAEPKKIDDLLELLNYMTPVNLVIDVKNVTRYTDCVNVRVGGMRFDYIKLTAEPEAENSKITEAINIEHGILTSERVRITLTESGG